jgi:oligopeptide transport system ATP-binding protein
MHEHCRVCAEACRACQQACRALLHGQRVATARALAVSPRLIVCDEPVSALDVSVQAQIINLLNDLQEQLGVAYIFISHNLALVRHISDRIAVMYLGQVVEIGEARLLRDGLIHPYSRALFSASPEIGRDRDAPRAKPPEGDVPSLLDPPSGCRFRTRCPFARERCVQEMPALRTVAGREVRCHYAEDMPGATPLLRSVTPGPAHASWQYERTEART